MKKILILACFALCAAQSYAQGTINFANTASQVITNQAGASIPVASGYVVGLYYGPAGTVDEALLTQIATTGVTPVVGRFTGGTVTTPASTAPGNACVLQIRAWSGNFANYALALAAAQSDNVTQVGKSALFTLTTGNPGGSPATTPSALTPLTRFGVAPLGVPEPSSIALGLLGLGAVALFRRKK